MTRERIFLAATLIALALAVPAAAAEWAPHVSYAVNTLVTHQGQTYQCLQAHTSQGDWEPPHVPALWALRPGTETPWRTANLTWFTSYPDPGSEECLAYNGCTWAGFFAFVDGQQSDLWVASYNIAAVHAKDAGAYRLKTLRLRQGTRQIDVTVYDLCADSDCDGCCTANSAETGFLIDLEQYTMQRFGAASGIVEWLCLDCP